MDPNTALQRIRELTAAINQQHWTALSRDPGGTVTMAAELAELVEGLDEWLSRGGYPPTAWKGGGWS